MIRQMMMITLAGVTLIGCTSQKLGQSLGTMKNPPPVYAAPRNLKPQPSVEPLIEANYRVILEAVQTDGGRTTLTTVAPTDMGRYLSAGFTLADIYCDLYFRDAEESQRRRKFGRAVTNDAGTAIATILGLANAGQNVVTGVAAGFGLGDNLWRNYDDAFVVAPDLSNVRSLVLAAQDNYRERTLGEKATLPKTYSTAQSAILRYANLCSTLGMRALLDQSATQERSNLDSQTKEFRGTTATTDNAATASDGPATSSTSPTAQSPADATEPITATPALTPG
jgi:hypothetical protein